MKKIKSGVKKLAHSKVFKTILIVAAVVYTGGAALGYWQAAGPLAGVNGALVKGGAAAAGGGAAGTAASTAAGTAAGTSAVAALPAGIETLTVTAPAVTSGASTALTTAAGAGAGAALAGSPSGAPAAQPSGTPEPTAEAPAEPKKGIISKMMDSKMVNGVQNYAGKALAVADKHPAITAAALTGLTSALSPDEIDILKAKQELELDAEAKERDRRSQNLNVSGIKIAPLELQPLKYASTGQQAYSGGVLSKMKTV